jgi:hypothetical protein
VDHGVDWVLHVWLAQDGGDGERVFGDVVTMLKTRVANSGSLTELPNPDRRRHFVARLPPGADADIEAYVGEHRVQLVPRDRTDGRVATSFVCVELLRHGARLSAGRLVGSLIRTYNYTLGSVTDHRTGVRHTLDDVLSGSS